MTLTKCFKQTDINGDETLDGRNVADALFYIGDQLRGIKEEMILNRSDSAEIQAEMQSRINEVKRRYGVE